MCHLLLSHRHTELMDAYLNSSRVGCVGESTRFGGIEDREYAGDLLGRDPQCVAACVELHIHCLEGRADVDADVV